MPQIVWGQVLALQQHFRQKFPDTVLLIRAGLNYFALEADAEICRTTLGLGLTTAEVGGRTLKLAGLPQGQVKEYSKRLVQAGYRVGRVQPREHVPHSTDPADQVTCLVTPRELALEGGN